MFKDLSLGKWSGRIWNCITLLVVQLPALHVKRRPRAVGGVSGIYHVGDEQPVTAQEFLDAACRVWGYARPRRVPPWGDTRRAREELIPQLVHPTFESGLSTL